jgi:hypothetical protein
MPPGMRSNRIEFISQYCDRWCERCAFTTRCSAYAVKVALGMCGNFQEAVELAVGAAAKTGPSAASADAERRPWLDIPEPTAEELREVEREEDARRRRIAASPIEAAAHRIGMTAHHWLLAHADTVRASVDPVSVEALEIVEWDSHFIGAKLHRALHGRDRHQTAEDWDDDPIQNDWNGSAKIALISIERSESAWQTLAQATGDVAAADLAASLAALCSEVEDAFPFARLFARPGFDDVNP